MANGFFGKILWVDLTRGATREETLPASIYRDYLGGYGLGCRLLYERMPRGADPLGAENILGFVPGLLTGTGVFFSGRYMVVAKSPLTGGWGDANSGGQFGPVLRATGYDGVFVTGVAAQPVVLQVDDGRAELRDARDLWGLDTVETERRLKAAAGQGAQVACIGPSGEKLARIAGIVTDGGRLAARSGLGAVMGSKRLKAIVVRGSQRVSVYDTDAQRAATQNYARLFKSATRLSALLFRLSRVLVPLLRARRMKLPSGTPEAIVHVYRNYGTCAATALSAEIGDAPIQNWRGVGTRDFPLVRSLRLSDDAVIQYQVKRYHCRHCPVGCGGIVKRHGEESHKVEYETLGAFGTMLLNDDLDSIIAVNAICNRAGLDTISTGAAVAFAIECAEQGLVETDGLDLKWGNAPAIVSLVEKIARREGIGDWLAEGVQRAASRIGKGAEKFAMHAGGQELPMHDPRYEPVLGLAYTVDPTPARHTVVNSGVTDVPALREIYAAKHFVPPARYAVEGKGMLYALVNQYIHVISSAGLCEFALMMGKPPVREWINATTGWELSLDDLLCIGQRIQTLRHAFNRREGIRAGTVVLPERVRGNPPLDAGPTQGVTLDVAAMTRDFFRAMGWDETTGAPSRESLRALGLDGIVT